MRARLVLEVLAIIIAFAAGFLTSSVIVEIPDKTVTVTMEATTHLTETVYSTVTETVMQPHLIVVQEGYIHTSCIYESTEPQEDPECNKTGNIKAITLFLRLANFGASDALIDPRSITLLLEGIDLQPFYVYPPEAVILSAGGSKIQEIVIAYRVTDERLLSYSIKYFGPNAVVVYMDLDRNYAGMITPELVHYVGTWQLPEVP